MKIVIKRAYEKAERSDGFRVLVDRLWPRGVSKDRARVDLWMKEVAPSSKLRAWFHEDRTRHFTEFKKRYTKEINGTHDIVVFKKIVRSKRQTTFVTAVKDIEHSHIPILVKKLKK